MKHNKFLNIRILYFLTMLSGLLLASIATGFAQNNTQSQVAHNDNMVMYLGKIEVRGKENIIKTLQAIKIGLRQPYSTDPKLADVMVCRLQDESGSHLKQWLICGTNRNLAVNRETLHTQMISTASSTDQPTDPGDPGSLTCISGSCYEAEFSVLNEALDDQPGHYLRTLVNGPAFSSLLHKIPYPSAQQTATTAPTAGTQHP